jgi:hypothetical protein
MDCRDGMELGCGGRMSDGKVPRLQTEFGGCGSREIGGKKVWGKMEGANQINVREK